MKIIPHYFEDLFEMCSLTEFIKKQLKYRFLFRYGEQFKCCCGSVIHDSQVYQHYRSEYHLNWVEKKREEIRIVRELCPRRTRHPVRDVERWNREWNEIPVVQDFRPSKIKFQKIDF